MVLRTQGGFLAGTNKTMTDGTQHCKLHYQNGKLMLFAGNHTLYRDPRTGKTLVDISKDLWTVFSERHLADREILGTVSSVVVRDAERMARLKSYHGELFYHLVLLSTDGNGPAIWTQDILLTDGQVTHVLDAPYNLSIGETFVWMNRHAPESIAYVHDSAAMLRELNTVASVEKRDHPQDHGFDPPFMLVRLEKNQLEFVEGDQWTCTLGHPLPKQR